jgi:alanine-glyoxylate transaminase/serine-glyoxylate transaminase/serine-pyruvate transaminase
LFIELMDDTKQLLQYAFKTQNELTIPLSAPGSAGMEAAFVNLVSPVTPSSSVKTECSVVA